MTIIWHISQNDTNVLQNDNQSKWQKNNWGIWATNIFVQTLRFPCHNIYGLGGQLLTCHSPEIGFLISVFTLITRWVQPPPPPHSDATASSVCVPEIDQNCVFHFRPKRNCHWNWYFGFDRKWNYFVSFGRKRNWMHSSKFVING